MQNEKPSNYSNTFLILWASKKIWNCKYTGQYLQHDSIKLHFNYLYLINNKHKVRKSLLLSYHLKLSLEKPTTFIFAIWYKPIAVFELYSTHWTKCKTWKKWPFTLTSPDFPTLTNIQYLVLQFHVSKCSIDLVHALWAALLTWGHQRNGPVSTKDKQAFIHSFIFVHRIYIWRCRLKI
jgi:hypothetical protein